MELAKEIVILSLSTFGITSALVYSSGPWGLISSFRSNKIILKSGLFECFTCMSFWVSLILYVAYPLYGLDVWLASWGLSVLLNDIIEK